MGLSVVQTYGTIKGPKSLEVQKVAVNHQPNKVLSKHKQQMFILSSDNLSTKEYEKVVKRKWNLSGGEGRRGWEKLRWSQWLSVAERDCEEWCEACRCFHILKEIDICVHSDADCTMQLQINNHNHKTPQDWLSIELSFFSLWQIWILLLQGSQMTLLLSVLWVCAYALVYLCVESIQISLNQWTMGIVWSVCVGNLVTVYRSVLLCECKCVTVCA